MSVQATLQVALATRLAKAVDGSEALVEQLAAVALALAPGTGGGLIDRVFDDTRTLAASANENLDLSGALVDQLGDACVFARVKLIYVKASQDNVNDVQLKRGASNGVPFLLANGDAIVVRPGGGVLIWCAEDDATGWAVTAGTADILNVTNSGGTTGVDYRIIVLGCSA